MSLLDPHSVLLAAGALYVAMPIAVLVILHRRHPALNTWVWCLSGLSLALGAAGYAVRGVGPDWFSFGAANLTIFAAYIFKLPVLRLEQGRAPHWPQHAAAWLAASALFLVAWLGHWPDSWRASIGGAVHALGAAGVTALALSLDRRLPSLSARLIALSYALLTVMVGWRTLRMLLGYATQAGPSNEIDYLLAVLAALFAAVCGNIGYAGLALENSRRKEEAQRRAIEGLDRQRRLLEASAHARDAVRHERYRSSQVLAHEVRQPLHNAAVALQAARAALVEQTDPAAALQALERAQGVLHRVSAGLDNTVAAAALLTGEGRVTRHEVELDMLAQLCVADLPPEARARVVVDHAADARSAWLEPGLVRLALRNLLINATLYAPAGSPVTLRLLDSDDPLALVIEVADLGPGPDPERTARLADPDDSSPPALMSGHGLGLPIVRRVALLHGGRLEWLARPGGGSVFRLTLPQGQPD